MARQRSDSVEMGESAAQLRCATARRAVRLWGPARHGGRGVRDALFLLLSAVLAVAPATTSAPPSLMGGQLTWEINRGFSRGVREVTFTLLTAFEMDPHCAYGAQCAPYPGACTLNTTRDCEPVVDHGFLCVDQYHLGSAYAASETTSGAFRHGTTRSTCDRTLTPYGGRANDFEIVRTQHINGLNIVFGKLTHTVVAENETIAMMAYFQHQEAKVLPQCQVNITDTALPCAVNFEDLDSPDTPQYALRTLPGFESQSPKFESERYWSAEAQHLSGLLGAADENAPQAQDAPMFEVYVRLCPKTGTHSCSSPTVFPALSARLINSCPWSA